MTTQGELPDIVERLRHPAWVHSNQPFTSPVLDQETCVFDMLAAADEIDRLRATPPGSSLERKIRQCADRLRKSAAIDRMQERAMVMQRIASELDRLATPSPSPTEREGE